MAVPFVPSRLATQWMTRLRELQHRLAAEPHHTAAWRWRIQIKVLTYFILRYGSDPQLEIPAISPVDYPIPPMLPAWNPMRSTLRSRSELRTVLMRIAEINQFKVI
jgi:hypothetical protein